MLGTQQVPFTRLLHWIEELINYFNITEEVVVQTGDTKYENSLFKCFGYTDEKKLLEYVKNARIIITHGGCGSIFNAILLEKKIIAVARLSKYGEMINDHQVELITKLSKDGYIIDGSNSLIETWKLIEEFKPRKYDFSQNIAKNLKIYIDTKYVASSISFNNVF